MRPVTFFAALVAVAAISAAAANELPPRKSGLWEVVTVSPAPRSAVRHCVGPGKDWETLNCQKHEVTKTSIGYAIDAVCQSGPYVSRTKSVVTGDFDVTVRSESDVEASGPSMPPSKTRVVVESRRLGDCEPAQKPGDIILPDGSVIRMPSVRPAADAGLAGNAE